jgi:AAA family ATP:ADP antiporter
MLRQLRDRGHRRWRKKSALALLPLSTAQSRTASGELVARLPRVRFISIVYHFFVANLVLFWVLLTFDVEKVIVARVFSV